MSIVAINNPQNLDLSSLTNNEKETLFLTLILANRSELEKANRTIGELRNVVQLQTSEMDDICRSTNAKSLEELTGRSKKPFAAKDIVWEQRATSKLCEINSSARPSEIADAVNTNKETRNNLRNFINSYKRNWGVFSNRKNTLIEYGKLILRNNPIISWNEMKPLMESAKKKITQKRPENIFKPERVISGYEDFYYDVDGMRCYEFELVPSKAAKLLFLNPEIDPKNLWTEVATYFSEDGSSPDFDIDPSD